MILFYLVWLFSTDGMNATDEQNPLLPYLCDDTVE